MLGSPRTGSTWLLNLLRGHPRVVGIDEPIIGMHLGLFAPDLFNKPAFTFTDEQKRINEMRDASSDYFFSSDYASVWRPPLKELLLARFGAQLAGLDPGGEAYCVIKEPNGSQGADVLLAALPGSWLLWVARDGRDVVDSEVDAAGEGSWLTQYGGGYAWTAEQRLEFVRERAYRWRWRNQIMRAAYDAHAPRRRLRIRYEDLLTDTPAGIDSILGWLGLEGGDAMRAHIERLSFDAVPAERRGSGQFARAATPGLWRENLTAQEQAVLDEVVADEVTALGYAR